MPQSLTENDPIERSIVYHPDLDPDKIYCPKGWSKDVMDPANLTRLYMGPNCHNLTKETIGFSKVSIQNHTKQFPLPVKPKKLVKAKSIKEK